jgi:hypothetical protein
VRLFTRLGSRTAGAFAATTLILGVVTGCGGNEAGTRTLSGVVTDVNASNITDVESFTIRSEGETFEIFVDPDAAYDFPPSHLSEHLLSGEPVAAEVEDRGGRLFALTLRDA